MLQKFLFYFYILLNSSGEMDLQSLTFKASLLMGSTGNVLFLQMAFFLNSDHPGRGCLNEVWDVSSSSRLGSLILVSLLSLFSISTRSSPQSEALHQHLLYWLAHFPQ